MKTISALKHSMTTKEAEHKMKVSKSLICYGRIHSLDLISLLVYYIYVNTRSGLEK